MSRGYYPILKWKKGEQEALRNLQVDQHDFYPVIEIVEECSPDSFFSALTNCYNGPIYFDVKKLDKERLEEYIKFVNLNELNAYPLLCVEDLDLLDNTEYALDKFSIKIPVPVDFEGLPFREIINVLLSHRNRDINVVLDAGEVIDSRNANVVFDLYDRYISDNIEDLCVFENVTVCLTSFPTQPDIAAGEDMSYKRYDILIYKKLIEKFRKTLIDGKIQYSDYGVTKFTETELDFSKMRYGILPKVKYTTDTQYIVKKGQKDRINNIFTRSYIDIAKEIVNSSNFYGENFSYGDECIYEKANALDPKPGNSTQWVTYCTNHHLTVLMEQLSNLF